MEAWDPDQLAMGSTALQICSLFYKMMMRWIAHDSGISAAPSTGLYRQVVKLRVLVCYVSFCCIPDLNRFKNNYSRYMYREIF
jgi:hypothetical protein